MWPRVRWRRLCETKGEESDCGRESKREVWWQLVHRSNVVTFYAEHEKRGRANSWAVLLFVSGPDLFIEYTYGILYTSYIYSFFFRPLLFQIFYFRSFFSINGPFFYEFGHCRRRPPSPTPPPTWPPPSFSFRGAATGHRAMQSEWRHLSSFSSV